MIGKGVEKTGYASESYEELKIFAEVLTQVKKHYVEEVQTNDLVHGAVRGMLKTLDPHSAYMTPEMYKEMRVETKGEFEGLGIQIGIKDHHVTVIAPIEGTPAHAAGIESGDVILKVDETPTKDLTLMEAVQRMRGPKGTAVTLTVEREGASDTLSFTLIRDTIKIRSVRSRTLDDRIGYVRISQFQESTPKDLGRELVKLQDKGRDGRKDEYRANPPMDLLEYPMIVLVNQGSASASEIVAAAMQDWGKAVILGKTTFGKGSVQTILPLSDGSGLRLTTAKYYTPSGESIHSVGVKPDIVVEPKPIILDEEQQDKEQKEATSPEKDNRSSSDNEQGNAPDTQKDLEAELMKKDVQLQKAIELIKTWKVFKGLHPLESA